MFCSRQIGWLAGLLVLLACSRHPAFGQTLPSGRPAVRGNWFLLNEDRATVENGLLRCAHGTTAQGVGISAFADTRSDDNFVSCLDAVATPGESHTPHLALKTANDQFAEIEVQAGPASRIERFYRDLPVVEIESTVTQSTDILSQHDNAQLIGVANAPTSDAGSKGDNLHSSPDFVYHNYRIYGLVDPTSGHGIGFVTPISISCSLNLTRDRGLSFTLSSDDPQHPVKRWVFSIHNGKAELLNTGIALINGMVLDRGPTTRAATTRIATEYTSKAASVNRTTSLWGSFALDTDADGHLRAAFENSVFRFRITQFNGGQNEEHAIRELVLKQFDEVNQAGKFIDAGAGRARLTNASVIEANDKVITVELDYANNRVTQLSIFPDSPVIRCRYVRGNVNIVDIGSPGGAERGGQYLVYGAELWRRPFVPYPDIYFTRYPDDAKQRQPDDPILTNTDPDDGGCLNYHGYFLLGVYDPTNGLGYGRVVPVHRTAVIKLLQNRGFEIFPGRITLDRGPSTQYFFVTTGGPSKILPLAKAIADGALPYINPASK